MKNRSGLRSGLLAGTVNVFIVLLGLSGLIGSMIMGWLGLSSEMLGAWLLLALVAFWGGDMAVRRVGAGSWQDAVSGGLVAGAAHGLVMAMLTLVVGSLAAAGADVRKWLVQLTPEAVESLTFGLASVTASVVAFVILTVAGVGGALLAHASAVYQWRENRRSKLDAARDFVVGLPAFQRFREYKYSRQIMVGIGVVVLLLAPLVLGRYWNYTLGTVGIYVILGLGLNIVVGLAGLLNLGYVAFFAIGAYSVALLTAPAPHGIMMDFWLALIIGVALSTVTGVLLSLPVLRTRGDYLAIVTLGFAEIIRILAKSDVLTSFTGGPRGVRAVAGPRLFGMKINNEFWFMYIILLGILLVAFITKRLQSSRVGRAWMAMREDEDVAQAMGIHTLQYKILAFAIGAAFAGLGGVIFASRNKFTGPEDFVMLVSINVLCLVIIGGMGSIPGVILGAVVLKGLPEILRQLDDYRMLAFGALLIIMMILRPEGLLPPTRVKSTLVAEDDPTGGEVHELAMGGGQ